MSGIEDQGSRPSYVERPPVDEEQDEDDKKKEQAGHVDPDRADAQIPEAEESAD